ncbi:MAG: hypothetical protein HUJ83_09690 [Veillonella sp.]|nr:hypothetical protein [Veillonella sp.]
MQRMMITKSDLAAFCNITRRTLDNVLAGADAKISTVEAIAKNLHVPVSFFFDEETSKNQSNSSGNGSISTNSGNVNIRNYSQATEESCRNAGIDGNVAKEKIRYLEEKIRYLQKLIEEKQRMIDEKERMITLLMK